MHTLNKYNLKYNSIQNIKIWRAKIWNIKLCLCRSCCSSPIGKSNISNIFKCAKLSNFSFQNKLRKDHSHLLSPLTWFSTIKLTVISSMSKKTLHYSFTLNIKPLKNRSTTDIIFFPSFELCFCERVIFWLSSCHYPKTWSTFPAGATSV